MKFNLIIFIFMTISNVHSSEFAGVNPTPKESKAFATYFQKSGLLLKNHKIKKLNQGPAFQVIKHACKDGDDLYLLSFDSGITLITPKNESVLSYPAGTGGSWTPVFKHDPHTGYFHFLGANVHRWARKTLNSSDMLCPHIEVSVHGSFCNKAGFEECVAILEYDNELGYKLVLPKN